MFSESDARELKRLMQKRLRAKDTATRRAMLTWGNGEKGKAARKKWYANGGAEVVARGRAVGTERYNKIKAMNMESICKAEKHRNNWTAGDEVKLVELTKRGKVAREIARELGRSIRAIERKRERLMNSYQSMS